METHQLGKKATSDKNTTKKFGLMIPVFFSDLLNIEK
jgi:hypothetical protein